MISRFTSSYPLQGTFLLCGSDTLIPSAGVICLCLRSRLWAPSVVVSDARALGVLSRSRDRPFVIFRFSFMALESFVIFGCPSLISLDFWLLGPQTTCMPGNRSQFCMKRDERARGDGANSRLAWCFFRPKHHQPGSFWAELRLSLCAPTCPLNRDFLGKSRGKHFMGDFSNQGKLKKFHRPKFPFYERRNCKEWGAADTTVGTALRLFSPMLRGVVLAVMGKAYGTLTGSVPKVFFVSCDIKLFQVVIYTYTYGHTEKFSAYTVYCIQI